MSRKVNFVSKVTDGVYTVVIKGNTMSVTDDGYRSGNKVFADGEKFDVGKGFWHCFKQIKEAKKKIQLGDAVRVIDASEAYHNYWQWFSTFSRAEKYMNSTYPIDLNTIFTVAEIDFYEKDSNDLLYCLEDMKGNIYLMGEKGIQKI